MPDKVTQEAAEYSLNAAKGRRCEECAHFRQPAECELVEGEITPQGTCKLWASAREYVEEQMFDNPPVRK